jgi:hypothetical protein
MLKMSGIALNAVKDKFRKSSDKFAEFNCLFKGDTGSAHFGVNINQYMQRLFVAESGNEHFNLIFGVNCNLQI